MVMHWRSPEIEGGRKHARSIDKNRFGGLCSTTPGTRFDYGTCSFYVVIVVVLFRQSCINNRSK